MLTPVRLLESAYRHGVSASDIRHAAANAIRHHDLDDGLVMLVGPDTTGPLLEVGIIASDEAAPRAAHAMPPRATLLQGGPQNAHQRTAHPRQRHTTTPT